MADAFLVIGFGLAVAGVYVIAGGGWACIVAGIVLFVAGGLHGRRLP